MSKLKITEEHKKACEALVQQKNWEVVKEILLAYMGGLKDITTLTEDEKKEDKNMVFLARLRAYQVLERFLETIGLLGQKQKRSEDSFE